MKDIKKAYDEIKISDREKNKIFNNIMENRKKSFSWMPILGFSALALASFGMFFLLGSTKNDPTIPGGNTPGGQQLKGRDIQLENTYRKEIIVNAQKYLQSNEIDLDEIQDGEELVIEGEKIVDNEEFQGCKGDLVIKRYNEDFSYSTSVTCDGEDQNTDKERKYVVYNGTLTNVFEVNDYVIVASRVNEKKVGYQVVNCDANFTVLDKEGNIVLNKLIKSVYVNEDSSVEIKNVNMFGDEYFLILELDNEMNFKPSGSGSLKSHYYLMVLNKEGEELSYKELLVNGDPVYINEYIGSDNGSVYYTGYTLDKTYDASFGIFKIKENNIDIIPYEISKDGSRKNTAINIVLTGVKDGNYYGYSYEKSFSGENYYSANKLFRLDENAKQVWEAEVDGNIRNVVVDDYVYVLAGNNGIDKIYTFTLDGEKLGESELGDFEFVESFYLDGEDIIIKGMSNEEYFFEIYNGKLEMEEKIIVDNSDLTDKYEWHFMKYWKLNNHKVTAGYIVEESIETSNSVLLVFNK